MLTLGANSTCDICLEDFGTDHKAPYSIHCGHVFCFDCIRRFSPPECPLCRTSYSPGRWMKLHVDLSALSLTGTEKEARRLQEAIGEVTTLESSEANLQQLINECQVFLQPQPRSMYGDLRVAYRMLSYLCEVKTDVAQLEADKSELQRRLAASEAARDKATDSESRLNRYVTRAENSYQTLFQRIVEEYADLNEELKELRPNALDHAECVVQSSSSSLSPVLASEQSNMPIPTSITPERQSAPRVGSLSDLSPQIPEQQSAPRMRLLFDPSPQIPESQSAPRVRLLFDSSPQITAPERQDPPPVGSPSNPSPQITAPERQSPTWNPETGDWGELTAENWL